MYLREGAEDSADLSDSVLALDHIIVASSFEISSIDFQGPEDLFSPNRTISALTCMTL